MRIAVTRVCEFGPNGVAVEYEIHDDAGTLLAADFVHMQLKDGETVDDVLPFFADHYLPLRAAKWALSDTGEKVARRKEVVCGGVTRLSQDAKPLDVKPIDAIALDRTTALALQQVPIYQERELTPAEKLLPVEDIGKLDLVVKDAKGEPIVASYAEAFRV